MSLRYLIDECTISGELREAIDHISSINRLPVDFVCVGDEGAPGFGTQDPDLVSWAVEHDRAIVSFDSNTLIGHYYRVAAVLNPPPLLIRQRGAGIGDIAEYLVLAAHAFGEEKYGQVLYFP